MEVLLLSDPVDSFWVTGVREFEGKPFKSVTQGAADLALIPRTDANSDSSGGRRSGGDGLRRLREGDIGDAVSDVRVSDR